MVGHDEPALRVEGEPVGADLPAWRVGARRVARRAQEDEEPFALLPFVDRVLRDVAEQQVAAALLPHGPFGPVEPLRELLDLRVAGDERIERGIDSLDPASRGGPDRRGLRGVLREGGRRGERCDEGERSDETGHEPGSRREFAGSRLRRETGAGGEVVNRPGWQAIPSAVEGSAPTVI